jgi:hypothetical protein
MIENPGNTANPAERFENALYNLSRGWWHAVARRLKNRGTSIATWKTIAAASPGAKFTPNRQAFTKLRSMMRKLCK